MSSVILCLVEIISSSLCLAVHINRKFATVPEKNLLSISIHRVEEKIDHAQENTNLPYCNRNLHCDIQQSPQLNPSHRATEFQHLALSTLNTKNDSIIQLPHSQYSLLTLFWLLLLITGTTDICNIVFRGAWRGISWQTETFTDRLFLLYHLRKCIYCRYSARKWSKKHFLHGFFVYNN